VNESLDQPTNAALLSYLKDVRKLPNERAKSHRFAALMGELYGHEPQVTALAAGIEKFIRIDTTAGQKRGFIDSYFGNAVIEFENSLKATGAEAEKQLREYTAGVWAKEGYRTLIAIATDGVVWKSYRPRLLKNQGTPQPQDVELDLLREFTVSEDTLGEFWIWLTSLIHRPQQTNPTAQQFTVDFGGGSAAFVDAMQALGQAWHVARESPEPRLAFDTWQRYLTVTYGSLTTKPGEGEEDKAVEELFLKHTYLASIARLLVWASLSKGKVKGSLREEAQRVLSGEFFAAQGLANLVEDDFFQWVRRPEAEEILAPVWERILVQILSYDLRRLNEDVLKGVYQELVDPKDRHDLGEYYTPDWLCQRIVEDLLPKKALVSVLDPTCGSGSFLRAAIHHLIRENRESHTDLNLLKAVLDNVVGIEIHPLAVTIARTTYVLALGDLLKARKRPIQIPVYLADSLFLPAEAKQLTIGEGTGVEIRFGAARDHRVFLPRQLIEAPDLFDPCIAACTEVAVAHAMSKKESPSSLAAYLKKAAAGLTDLAKYDEAVDGLWKFTDQLADLIAQKKNSIWAFIVRNNYRPAMMRSRFQFIIGNPPWLSYRYITDPEYQDEVKKRALVQYQVVPDKKKLFTQMELAAVFFAHALTTFGRMDARIGFVMPRSILSADQHANLRTRQYKAPLRLTGYWDMKEVLPLFNVPSCVLFGQKTHAPEGTPVEHYDKGSVKDELPVLEWEGRLPSRDVPWSVAEDYLEVEATTGTVIYLGERTAFSTIGGAKAAGASSPYAERFRQGAAILPRNFYFVRVPDLDRPPDPEKVYWAETDPEQAADSKPPYKDIFLKGQIEGRYFFHTAISKHLLPFFVRPPSVIALPVKVVAGKPSIIIAKEMAKDGDRKFAEWMEKVEAAWNDKRGAKAERETVYGWLDYQSKLTNQNLHNPHLVLYNAAGTNIAAAHFDRSETPLPFVVDHMLYWASCSTEEEAYYLTAILNSSTANEAIKPFQSLGLLGERHVHKKVLDLPFPGFDPAISLHENISVLGAKARLQVRELVAQNRIPDVGIGLARSFVRKQISQTLEAIDALTKELLKKS